MKKVSAVSSVLATLIPFALGQAQQWGQCGGIGWTGPITCVAGSVCTTQNEYYSQCLPGTVSTARPTTTTGAATPSSTAGLHTLAKAAGKLYFGSATDNPELSDSAYVSLLEIGTEFGQIIPGNSMKWDATEPSRGTFTFANGDTVANLARQNGQVLRGHNCVWHNQLPSWVANGQFTAVDLTTVIQNHCSALVSHYKGQMWTLGMWSTVSIVLSLGGHIASATANRSCEPRLRVRSLSPNQEPFNDDGTWRQDVFFNTLNSSYVEIALRAARAADPGAKLYINDYNIENTGAKASAMLALAKQLLADGVPLDGIGFQSHFIVGAVPASFQSVLEQFTALGLEVAITELDIRMTLPATAAQLAQQQTDYESVVRACANVEKCVGITIWDWTDKYSWVPSTFPGQGAPLPWDENFKIKPAYNGIVAALS